MLSKFSNALLLAQPFLTFPVFLSVLLGVPPLWLSWLIAIIPWPVRFFITGRLTQRTPFDIPILVSIAGMLLGFLGYAPNNGYGHSLYVSGYSQDQGEDYQETAVPGESVSSEIVLKNPTFQELRDFILRDTTSRNKFVLYKYECRHFATDVNNNAEAAGLRSAFVLLGFDRGQHAVVAFDTTDRGLVYIEPQTDARIYPEVGGKSQGKVIKEILIDMLSFSTRRKQTVL